MWSFVNRNPHELTARVAAVQFSPVHGRLLGPVTAQLPERNFIFES
jgi:hypothetical protein